MKTLSLLILTLFCTIGAKAQPWIVSTPGYIYYDQGNVGIGTTYPYFNSLFTVQKNQNSATAFAVSNQNSGSSASANLYLGAYGNSWVVSIGSEAKNLNALSFSVDATATPPSDKMTLLTNGNVGIGTTSPTQKLSIAGTSVSGIASQTNISAFVNNAMRINGSISNVSQDAITYQSGGGGGGAAIAFGRGGSYDTFMSFYTNPTAVSGSIAEQMRITSTGNVGIGTTNPGNRLEVAGKILINGSSAADKGEIQINNTDNGGGRWRIGDAIGAPAGVFTIYDAKNSTLPLAITSTGNVGIGTTNPEAKLTVKGKIVASEIQVKADNLIIPDYVFKPDYQLMPLSKVEDFVKLNQHLPEVPSEKEFKENGMNMAEMNALLLKKIEELTLYAIKQNEKAEEQNMRSIEQAKKIETLEKTVNNLIAK